MDNLNAHRNATVRQRIEQAGCEILFTPPYSPEFNPIEKTWAKLKDILRKAQTLAREVFDAAVARAVEQISISDIRGWVLHCGYSVN